MTDDVAVELLLLDDEFGYNIVAEPLSRNIDSILSDLQTARGAAFVTLLKEITKHPAYSVLKSDPNRFCINLGGNQLLQNLTIYLIINTLVN